MSDEMVWEDGILLKKLKERADIYGCRPIGIKVGYEKYPVWPKTQTLFKEHKIQMNPDGAELIIECNYILMNAMLPLADRLQVNPSVFVLNQYNAIAQTYALLNEDPTINTISKKIGKFQNNAITKIDNGIKQNISI